MFGLVKFLFAVYRAFVELINPNLNALKDAPPQIKYIASVLLACFWALAFSLWAGELYYLGYNVIGHVAVVSMTFATWLVFRHFRNTYSKRSEYDLLRDPARSPKCYDLTDEERSMASQKLTIQN